MPRPGAPAPAPTPPPAAAAPPVKPAYTPPPKPPRAKQFYEKRPPLPTDPLDMPAWNMRILGMAIEQCLEDETITDHQRRAQLIALARTSQAQIPKARLRAAERAVNEDLDHQEEAPGGELEDAPEPYAPSSN